jgi:hypothetical protein
MSLPLHQHNRLSTQHLVLEQLLQNASDKQLRQPIESGKWSVREQLAHLGRYQDVFGERVEVILEEEHPAFPSYVANNDPVFAEWKNRAVKVNHDMLKTRRKLLVDRFATLGAASLNRTGSHPVFGRLKLTEWVELFLLHEAHHIFVIFKSVLTSRK